MSRSCRPCPQAFIDEKSHSVVRVWGFGEERHQWGCVMHIGSEWSCLVHAVFAHAANLQVAYMTLAQDMSKIPIDNITTINLLSWSMHAT